MNRRLPTGLNSIRPGVLGALGWSLCLGLLVLTAGCGGEGGAADPTIAHDQTTPEGAIICLEDAYRANDIEAAVACKHFPTEARLMLESINPDFASDEEIVATTAEVLEAGFRAEVEENGFPDFSGVISSFGPREPYKGRDDVVQIKETCRAHGAEVSDIVKVANVDGKWYVVIVPER